MKSLILTLFFLSSGFANIFDEVCKKVDEDQYGYRFKNLRKFSRIIALCCGDRSERNDCLVQYKREVVVIFFDEFIKETQVFYRNATVRTADNFDAGRDARVIHKAISGWGTNENAIINVITKRTSTQRLRIAGEYRRKYKEWMSADLNADLSDHFCQLILLLINEPNEIDARLAHKAMAGSGTNERSLVDLIVGSTRNQLIAMKAAYSKIYNYQRLQDNLNDEISISALRKGLQHILLQTSGTTLLSSQDKEGMLKFFSKASKHDKNHMMELINALFDIAYFGRPYFYARRFRSVMAGSGTDDCGLLALVASRSERDLGHIKNSYQELYGHSLYSEISSETSGFFRKTLLKLL